MVDIIKELTEFANFVTTNEQAQLYIAMSVVGATITALTSVIISFLTRQS